MLSSLDLRFGEYTYAADMFNTQSMILHGSD